MAEASIYLRHLARALQVLVIIPARTPLAPLRGLQEGWEAKTIGTREKKKKIKREFCEDERIEWNCLEKENKMFRVGTTGRRPGCDTDGTSPIYLQTYRV